ncbi:MAG TPA: hypothetical protein VN253_13240 [Kofleriaceae bacterium]|nr:hypothetical protein [Kofleriaceae bacterium]
MGTAAAAILTCALAAAVPVHRARAECTGITKSGGRFATCFDPGNRLSITAGSDGLGGAIAVRHIVHFDDDPDLVWKMEHVVGEAVHATWEDRFSGLLYRGRYLRHARDGHIVLPLGTPKKVFLPFDIGALAEVGAIRWRAEDTTATLGVVKTAALFDLARSRNFRRRLAIGPAARWDIELERHPTAIARHVVAPFSCAIANLHLESQTGLLVGDLRVEAGTAWHGDAGWRPEAIAEATVERIILAVNDRPIALVLGARYETATDEAIARVGARVVLFHRRDPRVSLDPPGGGPAQAGPRGR